MIMEGYCVNKIKLCSAMLTRCEFNNSSVHVHLLFNYLSIFVMSKTWHQFKERSTALASLSSPLVLYSLCCISKPDIRLTLTEPVVACWFFISLKQDFPPHIW